MALGLVALMRGSLAEACQSGSAPVVQLAIGSLRDVAALLVALPPVLRTRELQASAPMGSARV